MNKLSIAIALAATLACGAAIADTYEISWYTIDGGGAMNTTGGTFSRSGTIGQPDASSFSSPMSGGTFTLVGGFWPAASNVCTLLGDLNHDTKVDGDDVQAFVNCLLAGIGANCDCADINGGGLTPADVPPFVTALMGA